VGTWTLTGETKASPFARGGAKSASTERLEWLPGGFFLVAHSYERDTLIGLTVISYDERSGLVTHTSYRGSGEVEVMRGTVNGNTMILSEHGNVGGGPVQQRMTIRKISAELYTFTLEMARGRDNWSLVYEGKGIKMRS
jgi:hypothetical protein